MTFVYKAEHSRGKIWAELFARKAPEVDFRIWPDIGDPGKVRFLAVWEPPENIAEQFPNLEILFSIGAGVDQIDFSKIPEKLPVVRMIEPGLTRAMCEYVLWAVLSIHRDMPAYRRQQQQKNWTSLRVWPSSKRRVGVMGLGQLGRAVLQQLNSLDFQCLGWSRTAHQIDSVQCFHGALMLNVFLSQCDILICLLPLTDSTRGILSADLFKHLPKGAALVHVGRGEHLQPSDLLNALDSGQLADAILDVTMPEPLPAESPLWSHPNIAITPHIASMTQPETAIDVVLDNIQRHRAGLPLLGLVDRARGY